jgi:carbonic anhydrase
MSSKNNTWEDVYINMLKNKDNSLNFKQSDASFCKEKCRFQFNDNIEKYLKVELSKEGKNGINSVMSINLSQNGEHKIIYNGGIENSSRYTEYTLQNIFIKLVSIHAINSEKYKMELIMKYVSQGDSIVYVCVLLEPTDISKLSSSYADSDTVDFFTEITNNFPSQMGKEYKIKGINDWKISYLLPQKDQYNFRGFYTYNTSQNINWIVFKDAIKIPSEFYYKFIKKINIKETLISKEMDTIPPIKDKITFISDYDESNIINGFDGGFNKNDDNDNDDKTKKDGNNKKDNEDNKEEKDKKSNDNYKPYKKANQIVVNILNVIIILLEIYTVYGIYKDLEMRNYELVSIIAIIFLYLIILNIIIVLIVTGLTFKYDVTGVYSSYVINLIILGIITFFISQKGNVSNIVSYVNSNINNLNS